MPRFILISGCSGGGKSILIETLAAQGHTEVAEPGRRIIAARLARPSEDMAQFARLALDMARQDLAHIQAVKGYVFFDRGVIDAATALALSKGTPVTDHLTGVHACYHTAFLAPPWSEIYQTDADRQ